MSVVLLIGAGLFVRTLQNLQSVDVGFNAANILMFRVNPALNGYSPERTTQLYQRMQSSLEALPGVQSVTFTRNALLSGSTSITGIYRQGQTDKEAKDIYYMAVAPKFFETMQIPMIMGRDFNERDVARARRLRDHQRDRGEEVLARTRTRSASAIGQKLEESGKTEIIGVIRDTKYDSVRDAAPATMYTPIRPARARSR